MADLKSFRCPDCGAQLHGDPSAASFTCRYCGSRAAHAAATADAAGDVAAPPPPVLLVSVAAVLVLLVGAGAALAVIAQGQPGPPVVPPAPAVARPPAPPPIPAAPRAPAVSAPPPATTWLADHPSLSVDIDGDGTFERVGWARGGQGSALLAAQGADGGWRWRTPLQLPAFDSPWTHVSQVQRQLWVADAGGLVRAVSLEDGQVTWTAPLGSRVRRFCGGSSGGTAELEDGRRLRLDPRDGTPSPHGAGSAGGAAPIVSLEGGSNVVTSTQHTRVVVTSARTTAGDEQLSALVAAAVADPEHADVDAIMRAAGLSDAGAGSASVTATSSGAEDPSTCLPLPSLDPG